jgi:phosphoenolpyruvate carboxykinase (ATP)
MFVLKNLTMSKLSLSQYGIKVENVFRNTPVAVLYEHALQFEKGSAISSTGALICSSGAKTGRSPKDKRIVKDAETENDIWWGDINISIDKHTFHINKERAIDYFNTCERIYVFDGFAGADPDNRLKVRIICTRAYHALFMQNMLIRPSTDQLKEFGEPDFTVFNGGQFPANAHTTHMTSKTSVDLSFEEHEFVILGTEYAGEMKKGVFTVMNYLMPKKGILSMHCSANEGDDGSTSLFFGLSGTGKTTLSADQNRRLIGDDEHCWTDKGIFNIEGGCYAKCIDLSKEQEPEIWNAIRFGSVLENVVYDPETHEVDYSDTSLTLNTRCSYPLNYIPNVKIPSTGNHPQNIVFLSCDAFGVLPPVSKLSPEEAMYHFISGYTSKVAGTEMGITEPEATFSACFGAAFLVWHPNTYASLLAEKMKKHGASAWLVNTGWTGGKYGVGKRMSLAHTRSIIDAINNGSLHNAEYVTDPLFQFSIPTSCPGVPAEILIPQKTWKDNKSYEQTANHLARLFAKNFELFRDGCSKEIGEAGPKAP